MDPASASNGQLHEAWRKALAAELEKDYMQQLREFLREQKRQGCRIFPPTHELFNAFNATPPEQVRVVIIGQDPYHGPGQAHGLCFSVRPGTPPPPSLLNIFKEIEQELGLPRPSHGCLEYWAAQGVLLLNAVLTVECGRAGSHQDRGWERFTDAVIEHLNRQHDGLVFMLWGSYARKKGALLDRRRHLVLEAPHPSPLSAHRGFFGCRHFVRANEYLVSRGKLPIDWSLPAA